MADPITPINTFAGSVRKRRVYYQALFVALPPIVAAVTPVPQGWHQQLSKAVPVAKAVPTQTTTFAVPASVAATPQQFGWYQQLSRSAAVAQAKPGSTFVPFNTTQVAQAVVKGWYGQTTATVRIAAAQPTQPTSFAVPASVAPPAQTPGQFGWYQQLSKSAPIVQAKPGSTFVPFNTAQVVISPQTVPLNYDAGSVQQRVVYYQSNFQVLQPIAVTANTITGIAWYQPFGVAVPTAKAQQGATFVPFNTAQFVATPNMSWQQPLSRAVPVAIAKQGNTFVPLNTAQPSNSITSYGWYAPLSLPARVAAINVATRGQGGTFVPFNTVQITPAVSPLPHNLQFHVTVGRLKSF